MGNDGHSTDTNKRILFTKAMSKNLFWSYAKDISFRSINDTLMIETILKYGDVYELELLFGTYQYDQIFQTWVKEVAFDERFKKLNFYLSKIYFDVDLKEITMTYKKETRLERLKLLASQN